MAENLPQLYYLLDNRAEPLPEWAYFFMRVGHQLAIISNDNYRIVIGLTIPTRAFASSLVATGVILARAERENSAQVQYIRGLEPGTPVYVRTDNNRQLRGVIEKFDKIRDEEWVIIRTGKHETLPRPLNRFASRITVSGRDLSLPEYSRSGYPIENPTEFLKCCLGEELARAHIFDTSFGALIVGKKNVIEDEVKGSFFACGGSNKIQSVSGCLQDILRIRQLSGAKRSYRVQLLSSSTKTDPAQVIDKQVPPIVIFDGAVAYMKLGHIWGAAHHIVLLDRTEYQFADAVQTLNQNYAYRLLDDLKFPVKIPGGVEMMIFKERI